MRELFITDADGDTLAATLLGNGTAVLTVTNLYEGQELQTFVELSPEHLAELLKFLKMDESYKNEKP